MKLEIDIPNIIYNDAKENKGYISVGKMEIAWKAIADGKPLEQEHILDKIRAEIEAIIGEHNLDDYDFCSGLICARKIIDKYKAEGEKK